MLIYATPGGGNDRGLGADGGSGASKCVPGAHWEVEISGDLGEDS